MGGRPPKPNEYHKLTKPKLYGTVKSRVENTPKAKRQLKPRCPANLGPDGKKEWREISKILKNYNMFTAGNQYFMRLLCVNVVHYNELLADVGLEGVVITDEKGNLRENPKWKALNVIEKKIVTCLKELGMSSLGLAKIGGYAASAIKNKTKMEELLD